MSKQDNNSQERTITELYDKHSSEFYDYHAKRGDVEFYVDCAVESGGLILEIGCGTGRILIPTARAGIREPIFSYLGKPRFSTRHPVQ